MANTDVVPSTIDTVIQLIIGSTSYSSGGLNYFSLNGNTNGFPNRLETAFSPQVVIRLSPCSKEVSEVSTGKEFGDHGEILAVLCICLHVDNEGVVAVE